MNVVSLAVAAMGSSIKQHVIPIIQHFAPRVSTRGGSVASLWLPLDMLARTVSASRVVEAFLPYFRSLLRP